MILKCIYDILGQASILTTTISIVIYIFIFVANGFVIMQSI